MINQFVFFPRRVLANQIVSIILPPNPRVLAQLGNIKLYFELMWEALQCIQHRVYTMNYLSSRAFCLVQYTSFSSLFP